MHAATAPRPAGTRDVRFLELVNTVSSVPMARHIVADDLRATGIPESVLESVIAVVTELVSNAVLHARPVSLTDAGEGVVLRWAVTNRHVLVNVTDGGGPEEPTLKASPIEEPEGRGLAIVDALARDWSVRSEDDQVTVQAVVGPWESRSE
ncbi:ATP-binding protein [Actinobacteria bacterium YIM 96077]|uniref:Histidine kinase/HSP90-like ATPase domain-containing protein n=1 Tax=Phytoactinopolyspora halophila TaxID=1981511 RepID=A0A329R0F3_9ACTN|nr:ATP-binding protein [Phytoactinopolyspora halophila]AYY11447.1 ATP-binding protein [Actinobacteria bacterium YIM 96077]RAW18071.1 hypothetical protein DPM12_04375 [Phytoactinopolyspora halophila]